MSGTISTGHVWPYYAKSNVQAASAENKDKSLGKEDFLRILITQLQNQDPMQPLQDKDFIAQMAQFSSVEQLINMTGELNKIRQNLGTASSMIGKDVQWNETAATGEIISKSGTVDSILIKDGGQYARVGDEDINLDDITSIAEGGEQANE